MVSARVSCANVAIGSDSVMAAAHEIRTVFRIMLFRLWSENPAHTSMRFYTTVEAARDEGEPVGGSRT